jgi:hypothetical protein
VRAEFRDGWREIPDHVGTMLRSIDTWRYTYEEALRLSEKQMVADLLNRQQKAIVRDALRRKV